MSTDGSDSDDNDDYMSAAFVADAEKAETPRLVSLKTSEGRLLQLAKTRDERCRLQRTTSTAARQHDEIVRREDGLNSPISANNIGARLLVKMGHKVGHGLGKSENGIINPISIKLKQGRTGIGCESIRESMRKDLLAKSEEKRAEAIEIARSKHNEFRSRLQRTYKEEQLIKLIRDSQCVLQQLDIEANVSRNRLWPNDGTHSDMVSEDLRELDFDHDLDCERKNFSSLLYDEQLSIIVAALRVKYCYCIWCGFRFTNTEDMLTECPGDTADLHDL